MMELVHPLYLIPLAFSIINFTLAVYNHNPSAITGWLTATTAIFVIALEYIEELQNKLAELGVDVK